MPEVTDMLLNESRYENGLWTGEWYFDVQGNLVNRPGRGYAMLIRRFNAHNQLVRVSCYDEKGGLTECNEGYAEIEYEYDPSGNESGRTYYNALGGIIGQ